ncbi:MAG: hypothetical protein WD059_04730 [Balneolaceae bacterium]
MSKNQKADIKITFGLSSFKIESFNSKIPKKEPENFGYNVTISRKYFNTSAKFNVKIEVSAKKSSEAKTSYCKLITETIFDIECKQKIDALPFDLRMNLVSVAYSTTRGVLFTKTENSFISNTPLPLLNIEELKKQDRKKKKEGK